jgi:hypothetical protein
VLRRAGQVAAVALTALTVAAVKLGVDSAKAFADAQAQQEKLNFAYSKFPAIADVTRESFDKLNTSLMLKTGFDDDALASGQAVLAQFGLTGKQLQKLTPLLLDYARASGQDVVSAAEDIGKAMLGQGRALKGIGIDFHDAGSVAANFDQVMAGLTTNVGGYAETFGTTAAGKFEILTAKWGEFQEKVGSALLPGLEKLMTFAESDVMPGLQSAAEWFATDGITGIKDFVDLMVKYKDLLGPAAVAVGVLTAAQWVWNAAMDANPIGAIIIGLAALVAGGIWLSENWNLALVAMHNSAASQINAIAAILQSVVSPINVIIGALNMLTGSHWPAIKIPTMEYQALPSGPKAPNTAGNTGWKPSAHASMAAGGIVKATPGGVFANIGEGKHNEAVIPLTPQNMAAMGGSGTTVNVYVSGAFASSRTEMAKLMKTAWNDAVKTGSVPRGSLA